MVPQIYSTVWQIYVGVFQPFKNFKINFGQQSSTHVHSNRFVYPISDYMYGKPDLAVDTYLLCERPTLTASNAEVPKDL